MLETGTVELRVKQRRLANECEGYRLEGVFYC